MAPESQAAPASLLTYQTAALNSLLNLNQPSPAASSSNGRAAAAPAPASAPVWKILILDEASKDVLATSLRVQDLRDQGVTLHMCVGVALRSSLLRGRQHD